MFHNRISRKQIEYWMARAKTAKRTKDSSRQRRAKLLSFFASGLLFAFLGLLLFGFAALTFFSRNLPSPTKLSQRHIPQSTKIFARQGELLYEIFGEQRRTLIELKDVPVSLKNATLAVEDANFYKHEGFDWKGLARAVYNIVMKKNLQGGSTITQQLVKNTLLTPERTFSRKIKEFILAVQIEKKYSKDEILQMYLNEAPYGGQAWGVGAASEMYFGKSVRDLTLAESAFLAGLPQSPSRYSPYGSNPELWKERQSYVLHLMVKHGFLSEEEADKTKKEELKFLPLGQRITAPHFVMYVKSLLVEQFGEKMVEQGGLKVTTSLDLGKQKIAEEEVKKQIESLAKQKANATNAGLVALNPKTGEVLAMVGSYDYFDAQHDGNVNVTLSSRQPGSAIKPIMYVTAFKSGYTAATFLADIRTCFPGGVNLPDYCPNNWDGKFWGPMLLRDALANSRNLPAVKMLQLVGLSNVLSTARSLGITTLTDPNRYGLSLTLGGGEVKPIEMASAFAVFANSGVKLELLPILKVEDSSGKILLEAKPGEGRRVLEEKYTYLVNNILTDQGARSRTFGNSFEIGRPLAIKTGTTNDNRDAWTIGYTPSLATAVWVGNFNNESMNGIMGSTGATPIFRNFMKRSLEKTAVESWEKPKEIVEATVDALSGKIPQEGKNYAVRTEIFIKGTEPSQIDDFHKTLKVCKSKGLLATAWDEENGNVEEKTFSALKELSSDWQKYTDEWMGQNPAYQQPPTEKCPIVKDDQEVKEPVVRIVNPRDGEKLDVYGFDVEAKVYTNKTITKVEFYWDNTLLKEITSIPYKTTYSLASTEEGEHQISVRAYDSEGNAGLDKIKVVLPYQTLPSPTLSPTPRI